MIDDHSEDATVVNNPGAWPGLWASLVKDIVADTPSANRVFVDLLNEPDHAAFTWQTVRPCSALESMPTAFHRLHAAWSCCPQPAACSLSSRLTALLT